MKLTTIDALSLFSQKSRVSLFTKRLVLLVLLMPVCLSGCSDPDPIDNVYIDVHVRSEKMYQFYDSPQFGFGGSSGCDGTISQSIMVQAMDSNGQYEVVALDGDLASQTDCNNGAAFCHDVTALSTSDQSLWITPMPANKDSYPLKITKKKVRENTTDHSVGSSERIIFINFVDYCDDPAKYTYTQFTASSLIHYVLGNTYTWTGDPDDIDDIVQLTNNDGEPSNQYKITDQLGVSIAGFSIDPDLTASETSICGSIDATAVLSPNNGAAAISLTYSMGADSNKLQVAPQNNYALANTSQIATVETIEDYDDYSLTFKLTQYPSVILTPNPAVKIKILPCKFEATQVPFSGETPPKYEYKVGDNENDPVEYWDLKLENIVFEPTCDTSYPSLEYTIQSVDGVEGVDYSEFLTLDPTSGVFTVSSQNPLHGGVYDILVQYKFSGYPKLYASDQTVSFDKLVQLTMTNPCKDTELVKTFEQDHYHAIIGQGPFQVVYDDFTDTVSVEKDPIIEERRISEDGFNFCGVRLHTLTEPIYNSQGHLTSRVSQEELESFVTLTEHDTQFSLRYGSLRAIDAGVHALELKVELEDYLDEETVLPAVSYVNITLFNLETDLKKDDVTYTLKSGLSLIDVPQLIFNPPLHESLNEEDHSNGAEIIYQAFLKVGSDRYDPLPEDLGILDLDSHQLKIDTSLFDYIGLKKIKLTFTGQDYIAGQSISTEFGLFIVPEILENQFGVQIKPFVDTSEVDTQVRAFVIGQRLVIYLPEIQTIDDIPAIYYSMDLGAAATFMTYDRENDKLIVEEGATSSSDIGDYPIKFQLIDAKGVLSEIYSLNFSIEQPEVQEESNDQSQDVVDLELNAGAFYGQILEGISSQFKTLDPSKPIPPLPSAKVSAISDTGIVEIQFETEMIVFDLVKTLNQDGILVEDETRRLDSVAAESSGPKMKRVQPGCISIDVIPGGFTEVKDVAFKWKVDTFESTKMTLKLDFEKPLVISSSPEPEEIIIKFDLEDEDAIALFIDSYGRNLQQTTALKRELPAQFADGDTAAQLEDAQEKLSKGTQGLFVANVAVSFILSASLQYLWEMINAQQIVILLPLFKTQIPKSCEFVFNTLMTIAAFEIFPTDYIYAEWFNSTEGDPLTANFGRLGFEHHLLLNNFGSLGFTLLAIFPILYVIYFFLLKCRCSTRIRKWQLRLRRHLFWNALLRMTIESYIIGLICCLLNFRQLELSKADNWHVSNAYLTCLMLTYFCLFPVISIRKMYKNFENLILVPIKSRYGELYEGYNIDQKKTLIYMALEYVRLISLCITVVYFKDYFFVQMFALFMSSVILVISSGHIYPKTNAFDNKMNIFNEAKLVAIMYHLMLFTMFVPDTETKYKIGYSCAVTTLLGFAVNMFMVIWQPLVLMRKATLLKMHKKQALNAMKNLKRQNVGKDFGKRCATNRAKQQHTVLEQIQRLQQRDLAGVHRRLEKKYREQQRLTEIERRHNEKKVERHQRKLNHQVQNQRRLFDESYVSEPEEQKTPIPLADRQMYLKIPVNLQRPKLLEWFDPADYEDAFKTHVLDGDGPIDETAINVDQSQIHSQMQDVQEPKKIMWQDIEYLHKEHNIGLADIEKIPAFKGFDVTDTIQPNRTSLLNQLVKQSSQQVQPEEMAAQQDEQEQNRMKSALQLLKSKIREEKKNKVVPTKVNNIDLGVDFDKLMQSLDRKCLADQKRYSSLQD